MKKLIIGLLLIPAMSQALECGETKQEVNETMSQEEVTTSVPAHLKGATITITLADGSKETVKAESYMVVKRKHTRPVVNVSKTEKTLMCETKVVSKDSKKNIVSVQAVRSQNGVEKEILDPTTTKVSTKKSVGAGVMYQRKFEVFNQELVGGIGADTNRGVNLGLGLEF